jgi:two-component system nitrogen regulation response regulator GlnG
LPTLASRREDIGLLLAGFLDELPEARGPFWPPEASEAPRWLRLMEQLMAHAWPGNVRELQQVARQIFAARRGESPVLPPALAQRLAEVVTAAHVAVGQDRESDNDLATRVPRDVGGNEARDRRPYAGIAEDSGAGEEDRQLSLADGDKPGLADLNDDELYEIWISANCEVAEVARRLGTSRPTVYRRLEASPRFRLAADVPLGELLNALDSCRGDLAETARRLEVSRRGLEARMRASGATTPRVPLNPGD